MNKYIIEKIEKNQLQFAIYDGLMIISSSGIGVKPIISPMRENKFYFKDKEVYDTVIGKAAAILLVLSGAKSVYGRVMSKSAILMLQEHNIPFEYKILVEYIQNRTKTGICPLEESVNEETNPVNAFEKIEERIKFLMSETDSNVK